MNRRSDQILRWLLPTLGGLLVIAAYAFPLLLRGPLLFATDGDPGRHIRLGSYMLETRTIPHVDLFSHTMRGEPFIPFEWLSEVIFAGAHSLAGLAGVALVASVLFATTVGLVYVTMTRAAIPSLFAFPFAAISMVLQAVHLHARPHMFTTLLVAAFSLLLLEARRSERTGLLLWLPLLMLIWANLHGGFLVGFILIFLFTADAWFSRWRSAEVRGARYAERLTGILGLCFAASLLTPGGLELWPHTLGYLGEDWLVAFTQEYTSPDFHDPLMKFFLAVLMSGVALLALLRTRVDLLGLGTWILFAAFALHSGRNVPLFGVLAVPWMSIWFLRLVEQEASKLTVLSRFMASSRNVARVEASLPGWPIVLVGLALVSGAALRQPQSGKYAFAADVFPVSAVDHLRDSGFVPPGPLYNEFGWGGYLLYAWPGLPVFIDGQTDFYGEALTQEYVRLRALRPDWKSLLEKHGIRWILIPPNAPLAEGLRLHSDWTSFYADSVAVAFVRNSGSPAVLD